MSTLNVTKKRGLPHEFPLPAPLRAHAEDKFQSRPRVFVNQTCSGVCIIVENLTAPVDRRVGQEARALTDAGYSVSVICPKGPGHELSRETRDGIEIYRHSVWQAEGHLGYLIEYGFALAAEFYLACKVYRRTRFQIFKDATRPT